MKEVLFFFVRHVPRYSMHSNSATVFSFFVFFLLWRGCDSSTLAGGYPSDN